MVKWVREKVMGMRLLALLVALISMPVLAADYTPWPDRDEQPSGIELLAQAQAQAPGQGQNEPLVDPFKPKPAPRYPGDYCCQHCRANQLACGSDCLEQPKNGKKLICNAKTTCACPGKP